MDDALQLEPETEEKIELLLEGLRTPEARSNRRWARTLHLGQHTMQAGRLDADTMRNVLRQAGDQTWLYTADVLADDASHEQRKQGRESLEQTESTCILDVMEAAGLVLPPGELTEPENAVAGALAREAYRSDQAYQARLYRRREQIGTAVRDGKANWRRWLLYTLYLRRQRTELWCIQMLAEDARHDTLAQDTRSLASQDASWKAVVHAAVSGGADRMQAHMRSSVVHALVLMDLIEDPEGGDTKRRTAQWNEWLQRRLARDKEWREMRQLGLVAPPTEPLARALALRLVPPE